MGDAFAEPLGDLHEGVVSVAGFRFGFAGGFLEFLDQFQRIAGMVGVVDQSPAGKAQRLPPAVSQRAVDFGSLEAEELHFQVVALGEVIRREPHYRAVSECRVMIRAVR